jgi:hypothetical protein
MQQMFRPGKGFAFKKFTVTFLYCHVTERLDDCTKTDFSDRMQLAVLKSDIPRSRQTPRFEDLFCLRNGVWLYNSASVAAILHHFEDLSDLRLSSLRTVNCIVIFSWLLCLLDLSKPHTLLRPTRAGACNVLCSFCVEEARSYCRAGVVDYRLCVPLFTTLCKQHRSLTTAIRRCLITVKHPIREPPISELSWLAKGFSRDDLSGYCTIGFRYAKNLAMRRSIGRRSTFAYRILDVVPTSRCYRNPCRTVP